MVLELGGIAPAATLRQLCTKGQLRAAVASGRLVRAARGVYALPGLEEHRVAAVRINGALTLLSAALAHGWPVKLPPQRPQVVVPRSRNVAASRRAGLELRWGAVCPAELDARVTDPVRTALDCARLLAFDEALSVADSALRAGVTRTELLLRCARLPRTGRSRAYRVVELAAPQAANPFESVLRAIVVDLPGACFRPQVWIGNTGRADLVDHANRVVLEADSFEFHADAASLNRDMVRYNTFVAAGYRVLRFGWRHVMFEQDYVRAAVAALIRPEERSVHA